MNGVDIRAGSKPIRSNNSGNAAPAVAARVVIASKLIPTDTPTKAPPPRHQAKGYTTTIINTPRRAPAIASRSTACRGFNTEMLWVLNPRITTVEL